MTRKITLISLLAFAGWLALAGVTQAAESPQPPGNPAQALPQTDQLMQRMLDRSEAEAAATNAPAWAYDKTQVSLKLDGDGKVEERTEKVYRVRIIQGVPLSRLIKIGGRDLTAAELEKENQREAAFEKGLSGRDPKKSVAERESLITTNIMERFQFKALRRETIHDRPTVAVSFAAKPSKSDSSIQDRLMNRMAGTVWVDEETADVARVEVHLTGGFSIGWFGFVATIKGFQMDLLSRPMTDGTWLPEKTTLSVSARLLLSGTHFKMEETSSNFTLEPAPSTGAP